MKPSIQNSRYILKNTIDQTDVYRIQHPLFSASISSKGAQLLSFLPAGQQEWLWLSPKANFDEDAAIRGGIPICLPWFGVNKSSEHLPKHGFARNRVWQLINWKESKHNCSLSFQLEHEAGDSGDDFKADFCSIVTITLSSRVELSLRLEHLSEETQVYSLAFHSYFKIDALESTEVLGVNHQSYLDNSDALSLKVMDAEQSFQGEVDSVFENIGGQQQLSTKTHSLHIKASNCPSCIIWNPGEMLACSISDIEEQHKYFVCVERGAAFGDSVALAQGELFQCCMQIELVDVGKI